MKKDNKTAEKECVKENIENENSCNCTEQEPIESAEEKSEGDKVSENEAIWQDKYIRLSADFDNFRKRTLKEKMDLIEYSGEDVIKSMLSVLDDMDRAVAANEKLDDIAVVKEGISLIRLKMIDSLKNKGVTEIEAIGEKLDTDTHDAIAKFPVDDESKKGCVIDVLEKGYRLKDKVIRYSKVVVGE